MSSVKIVRSREGSVVVVRSDAGVTASALLPHDEAIALAASVTYTDALRATMGGRS